MSNSALLSYFGVESLNLKNQATPFASRMLSGERRAVGAPITVENLRRHSSGGPYQYSRSISLQATSKSVVLPQDHGDSADSVFRSSNKENRPRAFSESDRKPQNSDRYKTELCRPFEESGTCKYGDKCQFAHGIQELRNLVRHPKYKTELCRTYHTVGICPYGPRCHFIHNPDELAHFSKPCNKDRTVGKPKLLHFPSAPLGSTGDLTPPGSVCDSPMSPLGDNFLEILKDEARKLICVDQSDFSTFTPSLLSTIPSPITSEPASPFLSESTSHYSYDTMQLKDNVFFPSEDSKPPSPVGYRPPSPPDSDPESYCESAPSPVPLVFSGPTYAAQSSPSPRNSRLPIFRGISMDENLIH